MFSPPSFYDIYRNNEKVGQVAGGTKYVSWGMFWTFVESYEISVSLAVMTLTMDDKDSVITIICDKASNSITMKILKYTVVYTARIVDVST
jgi:succinate-acetate transporter protein